MGKNGGGWLLRSMMNALSREQAMAGRLARIGRRKRMRLRGLVRQAETTSGIPPGRTVPTPSSTPAKTRCPARLKSVSSVGGVWTPWAWVQYGLRARASAPINAAKIVVTRPIVDREARRRRAPRFRWRSREKCRCICLCFRFSCALRLETNFLPIRGQQVGFFQAGVNDNGCLMRARGADDAQGETVHLVDHRAHLVACL
jgi:hypothetical protein